MAFVQEIVDLLSKLDFHKVVYEYQQGLYFRNGKALWRRKKLEPDSLAAARSEESKVVREMGRSAFLPFRRPEMPEGFYRSPLSGFPRHESRRSKVLGAGLYFHIPILDSIVVDSQQERVLNLANINVITSDESSPVPISVSCNLRYRIVDFYKAYTAVHDYEASLKDYTLAILSTASRGRKLKDYQDPAILAELEKKVESDLRTLVTERWGLEIYKLYITDVVPSSTNRLILDGQAINLNHTAHITDGRSSE